MPKGSHLWKHGMSYTRIYNLWKRMIARCYNKKHPAYRWYGARGINVSDNWRNFNNFFIDMGERPNGKSIDRIDNSKGYSKENCRWATPSEQNNNYRRNRLLTFNGETMNTTQWANKIHIKPDALIARLNDLKWSIEKALTTPHRLAI